jgi:hypothetical protein
MTPLDSILSARSEPAPATETQETTTQAAEATTEATEQTTEQQAETEGEAPSKDGKPPIGAIRQAEREKATKRYTEQVADFDKRLAEQNTAWERRFEQLLAKVGPQPEQKPAPDIFENPAAFVHHEMGGPLSEVRGVLQHNSRLIAEMRHTEEAVKAADDAFTQAYRDRTLDPADFQRITSSPNIYDEAVKWHKRKQALEEIGPDPVAYREKLKAEILAEQQAQNGQQQNGAAQSATVMPSNLAAARNVAGRSGPAWAGPTPLNDIFKR